MGDANRIEDTTGPSGVCYVMSMRDIEMDRGQHQSLLCASGSVIARELLLSLGSERDRPV